MIGNPPVIGLITLHSFIFADEPMGNPTFPWIYPIAFFGHDDKMTFLERIKNTAGDLYSRHVLHNCVFPTQQEFLNKYFNSVKRSAKELEYEKSLLIVSTDIATSYPKPVQPNIVYVGPMHLENKSQPLPKVRIAKCFTM